jgi:hypothetical protein
MAAMIFDHNPTEGESQSRAGYFSRKKRIEYSISISSNYSVARVLDRKQDN